MLYVREMLNFTKISSKLFFDHFLRPPMNDQYKTLKFGISSYYASSSEIFR